MTRTGSLEPKKGRRRLHGAADVAAAALILSGALLVGISVSQHQRHDHALAAQAARKAQIEQVAKAEAQQFRAAAGPKLTRPTAPPRSNGPGRLRRSHLGPQPWF